MADVEILDLTEDNSPDRALTSIETQSAALGSKRMTLAAAIGQKIKVVNSQADFPDAVAGVVTLEDDTG